MTTRERKDQVPEDEKFTMPAKNVWPRPVSRRLVLVFCALLGFAFAGTGVGTLTALRYSDNNTTRLDERGQVRDAERDRFEQQIQSLTNKLAKTQTDMATAQAKNSKAICSLIIGSIQNNLDKKEPASPLLTSFLQQYGCTLPTNLPPVSIP